jgi:hypothetical protein
MAEERNAHVKLAMAEVFGLYLIALIGILVGLYGLKSFNDLSVIVAVAPYLGLGLLVCTFIAFWNENLLLTGIFGVLAIFLLGFPSMATAGMTGGAAAATAAETYIVFIGVLLLVMALVSWMQPVKMLPILLVISGIAFIFLGIWFKEGENYRQIVGVLWLLVCLLSTYMAAAISILVVKGKPLLPLLIKA